MIDRPGEIGAVLRCACCEWACVVGIGAVLLTPYSFVAVPRRGLSLDNSDLVGTIPSSISAMYSLRCVVGEVVECCATVPRFLAFETANIELRPSWL